jgi:autonomous glycyl radical cofactor GrcA
LRRDFRSGKWGAPVAEEILVKEQLAPEMIAGGYELTKRLRRRENFGLLCSLWLYTSERNSWRLMVGTPLVENSGFIHTYQLIQGIMEEDWPAEWEIQLSSISLLRSNHPLVQALRSLGPFEIRELPPGPKPSPTVRAGKKVTFSRVQDVFIEDAYIYFIK